jgi:adenine-specific DNA-methyltransferase
LKLENLVENKKQTGSYYTPKTISEFIVNYLSKKTSLMCSISILEPSAGDGSFVGAVFNDSAFCSKVTRLLAIEKNSVEAKKISQHTKSKALKIQCGDFLLFDKQYSQKFDIVIGNPPYIKKKNLSEDQVKACEDIHQEMQVLSNSRIKNIWTAFLLKSIKHVKENGIVALVLPSDLLQVKFSSELRTLLLNQFQRIEVLAFNQLLFQECKGQDTIILIAEKKAIEKGLFFSSIDKVSDLVSKGITLSSNVTANDSKWTHHVLSSDEFELLERLRNELQTVGNYCSSKAGIVTGANDFFIINQSQVDQYSLQPFVTRIIQKGSLVNGSVSLTKRDFEKLIVDSKPTYLLNLGQCQEPKHSGLKKYLALGESSSFRSNYKISIRDKWYVVPNVGAVSEALFFKRCHEYPKFILNEANVLSTDSGYLVQTNTDFKMESLIYSFYNSLTLSFAELGGRYYGGGVLELTPSEFRSLPLPYVDIGSRDFSDFAKKFKTKKSISEICTLSDERLLKSIDRRLDGETIQKISSVREKLFLRRTKK